MTPTEIDDINTYIIQPIRDAGFLFKKKMLEISDFESILDGMYNYENTNIIEEATRKINKLLLPNFAQPSELTDSDLNKLVEDGINAYNENVKRRKLRNTRRSKKVAGNMLLRIEGSNGTKALSGHIAKHIVNYAVMRKARRKTTKRLSRK